MLFLLLFIFFIILSGKLTWEIALAGIILCALADLLACRVLGWSREKSRKLLRLLPDGLLYVCILFRDIIKANIDVIKVILSPNLKEMNPALFVVDSKLGTDFARTVLADSITITPGTYTVKTDGDDLLVHRLGDSFAFGTMELELNRRLYEIEKKEAKRNA